MAPSVADSVGRRIPVDHAGEGAADPRLRALPDGTALPSGLVEAMRQALPECLAGSCLARAFPPLGKGTWLVGPVHGPRDARGTTR